MSRRGNEKSHSRTNSVRFFPILCLLLFTAMAHADPLPADRRIDWTHVGVPGGVPTNYTFFCNVTNIPGTSLVADPTGVNDSTIAIQTAINLATNYSVVNLPGGTFVTTNNLSIVGKHIILRGVYGQTWITNANPASWFGNCITINVGSQNSYWSNNITGGATNGSFSCVVGGSGGSVAPTVGYWYLIGSDTDPGEIIRDGCNDSGQYLHNYKEIVLITNVTGNTVMFTPPLRWDLATNNPWFYMVSKDTDANYCGVENLNLAQCAGTQSIRDLVFIGGVQCCWVTGCHLYKCQNNAVELAFCSHCTLESNFVDHAWDYEGGWGYGFWLFDCDNDILMENNIFNNMRHGLATEGWVTGCVFAYNYMTNECFRSVSGVPFNSMSGDIITHAVGAKYNLIEGNVTDRIWMDNTHASGLRNTIFRNRVLPVTHNDDFPDGSITYGCIALDDALHNNYISEIGNVLGVSGLTVNYEGNTTNSPGYANYIYMNGFSCDNTDGGGTIADCMTNLLRAVNWDTATGTTISDVGVDTNLPASYYLTSKPSWWGSGAWPSIGPDLSPMFSTIPAQDRFVKSLTATAIAPPSNLHPMLSGL